MGLKLDTRYGAVDVTIQDGRTAYVRVGTDDSGSMSADADTTAPLQLPRGVTLYGREHFKLNGAGSWQAMRGFSGLRRGPFNEPTPKQLEAAHAAIVEALDAGISSEQLDDAQYTRNLADAAERRAQAKALVRMADQLNRQATELEMDRGARVVYLNQRLRSGTDQDAIAVRTSSGETLFVDEPRAGESVNERGLRRYMGEPADWTERS